MSIRYPDGRPYEPSTATEKVLPRPDKPSKYRAIKTEIDGIVFDSQAEGRRYRELLQLQQAGEIHDLQLQVPFKVIVNGKKICTYLADFQYTDVNGKVIVEDVKSQPTRTPTYRIKKKIGGSLVWH